MTSTTHESVTMSSVGFSMHEVGKLDLLHDEDPQEIHLLWLERVQEFAPDTPYMLSLVQRMVNKEIKIRRYERRLTYAIDEKFRAFALSVLSGNGPDSPDRPQSDAKVVLTWVLDPSHEKHSQARDFLEASGHTVSSLRGKAFVEMQDLVRETERMIAGLERERDGLRNQIEDMRFARAKSVDAAAGLHGEIVPPRKR